jgi:hypothetical protein
MKYTLYVLVGWQLFGIAGSIVLFLILFGQLKQRLSISGRKPVFATRVWRMQRIKRNLPCHAILRPVSFSLWRIYL